MYECLFDFNAIVCVFMCNVMFTSLKFGLHCYRIEILQVNDRICALMHSAKYNSIDMHGCASFVYSHAPAFPQNLQSRLGMHFIVHNRALS